MLEGVEELRSKGEEAEGLRVLSWAEALALGGESPLTLELPELDHTALVCYTSGTTGTPKGLASPSHLSDQDDAARVQESS